jgi:hypothetical protein
MTAPSINDPAYWRQRAEEARRTAGQVDDPLAKKTLLDIARCYEQLSILTQTRLTSKTS